MVDIAPGLDRFEARVVPTSTGTWTFRVEGWSDPYGTWAHDASIKVEAGVDVELMLTEGALLLEKAARRKGSKAIAPVLLDAVAGLRDHERDRRRPARRRPVVGRAVPRSTQHPIREAVTAVAVLPARRRPAARPGGLLVRVLPPLGRRHVRLRHRHVDVGHAAHGGARPAADRGDGVRRRLPDARAPHRHHVPQGPQQLAARRAGRPGLAVRDRVEGRRARRDRAVARHVRRLRRLRGATPARSAWRSRSTSRCSARRTTRGSPRTPSGSPRAPTARSPTPRTRPRSTRTSTR